MVIQLFVDRVDQLAETERRMFLNFVGQLDISLFYHQLGWGIFDDCSKNLVVYCDVGSEIHTYCERNKITNDRICNMETN